MTLHINRMKDKNNIAVTKDTENICNETQHPFTIKHLKQLCIEKQFKQLCVETTVYRKQMCIEKNVLQHNKGCVCVYAKSFSRIQLFATLWIVAHQAPLSMGFFRQEYWSGLSCPPPGNPSDSGIEPASLTSPALAGRFFTTRATWEVQ